jgi:primosomal protein N' (replication factor Y)
LRSCAGAIVSGSSVKSPRAYDLSGYLRGWLSNAPKTRGTLKLEVDIDPQSFL